MMPSLVSEDTGNAGKGYSPMTRQPSIQANEFSFAANKRLRIHAVAVPSELVANRGE